MKGFAGRLLVGWALWAASLTWAGDEAVERIRQQLEQVQPGLTVVEVAPSPVAGLYRVQLERGPMVYASADGRHFILGDLFAVDQGRMVNLSEQERDRARATIVASLGPDAAIVYPARGETRATVSVFTDVECPWCQRFHTEVPELNELGVEVRYLAYPRAGLDSPGYRKLVSAWCAEDPNAAMDRLKRRQSLASQSCADHPVATHFELGNRLGVNGTPALLTESGRLLPGYMPARQLAEELGLGRKD